VIKTKYRSIVIIIPHGSKNISTPIKPHEVSSITPEENYDIHNKLPKLEDQLNDLSTR
jgi:hypothetical protein